MSTRGIALHRGTRPLHVWRRNYPSEHRIASALIEHRDVLNLRTGRLWHDVSQRFGICETAARRAIAFARKAAQP